MLGKDQNTEHFARKVFDNSKEYQGEYSNSAQLSEVMEGQEAEFQTFLKTHTENNKQPLLKTYFTFTGEWGSNPVFTMLSANTKWFEKQNGYHTK